MAERRPKTALTPAFIAEMARRVGAGERTRRSLPQWGRLNVDRLLPFLVVYRRPSDRTDPGMDRLAAAHASYMTAATTRSLRTGICELAGRISAVQADAFGASALVEIWSNPGLVDQPGDVEEVTQPRFRLHVPRARAETSIVRHLVEELGGVSIGKRRAEVEVVHEARPAPPGLSPLVVPKQVGANTLLIGLEVAPIHTAADGTEYPLVLRDLAKKVTRALAVALYVFARDETSIRPRTYHSLGRRATVKAVWEIDAELAAIGSAFELLLLVTPVNGEQAWNEFRRRKYGRAPTFYYRASPVEPSALKRRLHEIKVERVEDPTLADLFEQQRESLDRQISLIGGRERPSFLYDSLALHGRVEDDLRDLALTILDRVPPERRSPGRQVGDVDFARSAEQEIDHYRAKAPDLSASVVIRDDVSSLMVSGGNLLVPSSLRISNSRVEALLHHELGTHLLTNYNGNQQRLRLLASGLAGYDALQEGLGVFSEYLVGGLSRARIRLLAGRVVAARMVAEGAEFVDTFRVLTTTYGFSRKAAFTVTMRVYRSGGFVKDAVYLRGLRDVFRYTMEGGDLRVLYAGKMALSQVPIIEELQRRKVLVPAVLEPRYLADPGAQRRLEWIGSQSTVESVLEELWE